MLTEYDGPANSNAIFRHIVGERIVAAFQDNMGQVWIALESGGAIVFNGRDGASMAGPVFWPERPEAVQRQVERRREQIASLIGELGGLDGAKEAVVAANGVKTVHERLMGDDD